jgi:hypothetical protein
VLHVHVQENLYLIVDMDFLMMMFDIYDVIDFDIHRTVYHDFHLLMVNQNDSFVEEISVMMKMIVEEN